MSKRGYRVPQEIREQIINRIKNEGVSVQQAATDHGVHVKTIYGWLGKGVNENVSTLEYSKLKKENELLKQIIGDLTIKLSTESKGGVVKMEGKLSNVIGLSRASYYYKSKQEVKDWETKVLIENILVDHPTYGHKRLATHLKINRKKVLRVMHLFGIKPYRRTTKKRLKYNKIVKEHLNLLLTTIPEYYGHIWAIDFTYIKYRNKWVYVSTIIDLYSRKIVGLSISTTHNTQLITNTLMAALLNNPPPKILHSDNGKEYLSETYDSMLDILKIIHSCSRPGCP